LLLLLLLLPELAATCEQVMSGVITALLRMLSAAVGLEDADRASISATRTATTDFLANAGLLVPLVSSISVVAAAPRVELAACTSSAAAAAAAAGCGGAAAVAGSGSAATEPVTYVPAAVIAMPEVLRPSGAAAAAAAATAAAAAGLPAGPGLPYDAARMLSMEALRL
jgi:hypothetical protein